MVGTVVAGKYRVLRLVGRSMRGMVYLAEEESSRERVAVRFIDDPRVQSDLDGILRFKKEADILRGLSHPRIARLLEIGFHGKSFFIVTQFAEGKPLDRLVDHEHRPSLARFLLIAKQVAEALGHVHENRVLHGDVKPASIVVREVGEEPEATLLDFGVTSLLSASRAAADRPLSDYAFMSPERFGFGRGGLDPRSDVYSLGTVLHFMLTGRPPFSASNAYALMHQHVAAPPPSIRERAPEVPAVLERIVLKAMAKDPESRYLDASSLASDLDAFECQLVGGTDPRTFVLGERGGKTSKQRPSRLVGREAEMVLLLDHLSRAQQGEGGIVVLRGDAGIGKTRLAEAFQERVFATGGILVSIDHGELSEARPYAALLSCLDRFFELATFFSEVDREAIFRATGEIAGNLSALLVEGLPTLRGRIPAAGPVERLKVDEERRRFEDLILRVMNRQAEEAEATVYFVDNIQWTDRASRDFLLRLSRSPAPRRFMVLCSERSEPEADGFSSHLAPGPPNAVIDLGPLTGEQTRGIVAELSDIGDDRVDPIASRIQRRTGGNPFYTVELVKLLQQTGELARLAVPGPTPLGEVLLSEGSAAIIRQAIARHSEESRSLIAALAVLGKEFSLSEALACLPRLSHEQLLRVVGRARREGILSVRDDSVAFCHDLVHRHLYELVAPETRAELHENAARYHERRGEQGASLFRCARHYARSGRSGKAVSCLVRAGLLALRRNSAVDAIDYFREALGIEAALDGSERIPEARRDALAGLAAAYGDAGLHALALERVEDALGLETRPEARAALEDLAGTMLMESGDFEGATARLFRGLAELGERRPAVLPADVFASLGRYLAVPLGKKVDRAIARGVVDEATARKMAIYEKLSLICFWKGKSLLLLHTHFRSLSLIDSLGPSEIALRILCVHTALLVSIPWPRPLFGIASAQIDRTFECARRLRDAIGLEGSASCLFDACFAAVTVFNKGQIPEGKALVDETMARYWALRTPRNLQEVTSIASQVLEAAGDLEGLRTLAERTREVATLFDNPLILATSLTYRGMALHGRGDDEGAEPALREAMKVFLEREDRVFHAIAGKYLVKVLLARGRLAEGEGLYRELDAFTRAHRIAHPAISALHGYPVEARLMAGLQGRARVDLPAARRQIARLRDEVSRFPFLRPLLARVLVLERSLSDDPGGRERVFREGLSWAAERGLRHDVGLLELCHALGIRGEDPARAAEELGRALLAFDEAGAWREKDRVRRAMLDLEGADDQTTPTQAGAHRQRTVQEIEAVIGVGKRIAQIHDLKILLQEILSCSAELVGADQGELFLYEESALVSRTRTQVGPPVPSCTGVVSRVDFTWTPVVVHDALSDRVLKNDPQVIAHGLRSIVCIPLAARDKRIGVLYLSNRQVAGLFGEHELDLLYALAGEAAIAIENTLLLRQTRALQARLGSIVDSMPLGIVAADAEGRILLTNRTARTFLPELEEPLRAAPFWEVAPRLERFREPFLRSVGERVQVEFAKETLASRLFQVSIFPLAGEQIEGGVLKLHDVTEELRREEEIRQAQKMESIGQLAGGVAHDFNNMLAGIMGSAELLACELPPGSELHELASTIIEAAKRAGGLTTKLLAFSRKGKKVSVPVNLHEPLSAAGLLLERTIDKRIRIVTDFQAASPFVLGDPVQLENAFLNLGINSRDAMSEGGTVTFATRSIRVEGLGDDGSPERLPPGAYVEVTIRDTGRGMSAEVQAHLFEPFFTTKEVGKGTGLGLAAVYGTIKEHLGGIEVVSTLGEGTAFTILLPQLDHAARPAPRREETTVVGMGRVLVVDDEPIIRQNAQAILKRLGYEVLLAPDGYEAIEIFRRENGIIKLVILDLVMPKLSGQETLARLREINASVAVILSSGLGLTGGLSDLVREGAVGFIQKPYGMAELSRVIADAQARLRQK
jgi:signal transduction histidine kinase/CheY-like chemotaxis protein/tetratricopeptide (TPR) repeat protein